MNAKKITIEEAQKAFAAGYNGKVWELLEKIDRSADDNIRMLHYAHASCAHWLSAGTEVNHQRGEWMISRVNAVLGYQEASLRHALVCLRLTEEHTDKMADFDVAFAYEAMARAHAAGNNREEALEYLKLAESAGKKIADNEDRKIFQDELNGGDWNGFK